MNSFCTEEHMHAWVEANGRGADDGLFLLDVQEARTVAQWLFGLEE